MSLTGKTKASTYKDILQMNNSNSGVDSTVRNIVDGEGNASTISTSGNKFLIQPSATDSTSTLLVRDKDSNNLLSVDSTNDLVKAGIGQHIVNTQYASFGTVFDGLTSGKHMAVGYSGYSLGGGDISMGIGTDPSTSVTFSTTADDFVNRFMYVHDDITIDSIQAFVSDSGIAPTDVRFHIMSYDIDTSNGSTSGDVSGGVVVADGADLTSVNYSAIDNQAMTIQSANVDAGKVIVATALFTDTTDKKSVNIQLKYHLR